MEILRLRPEQRLSQAQFDYASDSEDAHRAIVMYTCPVCGQTAKFPLTDLIRKCQSIPLSGSKSLSQAIFDQETKPPKGQENPDQENAAKVFSQDFHCSGCNQPVRIEYTVHFPSSNRCSFLKIARILEIVSPPFPSKDELLANLNKIADLFYSLSSGQPPSAFPYLWLAALLLFPLPYDNPKDMAESFFQEKQKFDAIIGWSFAWEWIGEDQALLVGDQFSLWLAMILRFKEAEVESVLVKMLKIADLLQRQGMEKSPRTLAIALALTLENCSNEEISARIDHVIKRQGEIWSHKEVSGLFGESLFMLTLTGASHPDELWKIKKALEERNFLLAAGDQRSASVLLSLQGSLPRDCVNRFMELGEAFNLAMTRREESLVDPAFFPDESHPFQKVVLSVLNEYSPAFPFDSSCFAPIALLCTLPWKAEDLARESIRLYHYLRSYRRVIRPGASFWLSTGLVFSTWEGGKCPYLLLFWFLASLSSTSGLQIQEKPSHPLFIHRV